MLRRARLYCSVVNQQPLLSRAVCSKHLEIDLSFLYTYEEVGIRPVDLCILLHLQTLYI